MEWITDTTNRTYQLLVTNPCRSTADTDEHDNTSLTTADYVRILPPEVRSQYIVPTQVDMPHGVSTISGDSSSSSTGLPFLTAGPDKALPRYSGKEQEDINEFVYKLKIFLEHPSIDNCQKEKPPHP